MFEAKYSGSCARCEEAILPGQSVKKDPDGDWVHGSCVQVSTRRERKEEVCVSCFMVRPCTCDDERESA